MKFSEKWLREWVNPSLNSEELTELLTMGGMEVDGVEQAAPDFSGVVIAKILSAEKHPDADKLQLCQVEMGGDDPVQIVCGASNARAGLITALSTVGGKLPGGLKIKKAKLRGVESFGMLSSASELGLEDSLDGIIELPADAPIGQDLREYLNLDDQVIEIDLTPNRGDCFSIKGISRDVSVLTGANVTPTNINPVAAQIDQEFPIDIQANDACPNYVARVISDIPSGTETPIWMQERLRRSSVRSIHPIVDITNYVMLELGQPMHAFDLEKLNDGIVVRYANENEKLALLDDSEITLEADTLVIADHKAPIALAGIMGGLHSSVTKDTQSILLESAFFSPAYMAGKARRYRKQTDSSHRFERGVDFQLQVDAIERATQLIQEICGGQAGPVLIEQSKDDLPAYEPITLRRERLHRILGEVVDDTFVIESLTQLGMQVTSVAEGWQAIVPTHRFDMTIEVDLIEEICRIKGYDNLPISAPKIGLTIQPQLEEKTPLSQIRGVLTARGYHEAITYSFVEPEFQASLTADINATVIPVANPISKDMSVMRTSLLPGLISTLKHNLNRQHDRVRLFETGLTFYKDKDETIQRPMLAGIICGNSVAEQWSEKSAEIDFYDLKNDIEAILSEVDKLTVFEFERAEHPALHPGQSAVIRRDGEEIGKVGMLSPMILSSLGLSVDVGYFEVCLESVAKRPLPKFTSLSKFPAVRRDISLVVDESVAASDLTQRVRDSAPDNLINLVLFDVYVGEGIDSEKKSVSLGLIFQGSSSTLTDSDIDASLDKILTELHNSLGATLRV